ncbi:MAG: hypothetical protein U0836_19630 [Pirellulales bacterium]
MRISGWIEGPDCPHAATLQARFPLRDLGADPQPLAQATVTEPCFWSPRTPYVYRARVEVWRGERQIANAEQLCAARPLGTVGRSFVLATKRWVLRGVCRETLESAELSDWLEAAAVACVPSPADDVCRLATLQGLGIAAQVEGSAADLRAELTRLARWPAVMAAFLPEDAPLLEGPWTPPSGLLLVQRVGREVPWRLRTWAQAIVAPMSEPAAFAAAAAAVGCPVIAWRPNDAGDLPSARAECDRLQRDLAAVGDFAGYLV